jgi:tellurite resistance protein TerC
MGSGSPLMWGVFAVLVTLALILDLGVFRRTDRPIGVREALVWVGVWVLFAAGFAGWLFANQGAPSAYLFGTGYVIEYALSVDNLFVFVVVFTYFKVAPEVQHRVLFWGILSAAVFRAILIFVGAALITAFHWVLYLFGAFLLYSAAMMFFSSDDANVEPGKNPVLRILRSLIPLSEDYDGSRFLTRKNGRFEATPLLAVLLVVETTDVFFALDSVPAIFSVTTDTFIVYTSNIFAILGLRSLYFALSALMGEFRFLNTGVALVLVFISLKMLTAGFVPEIPTWASLATIVGLLGSSVAASVLFPEKQKDPAA